MMNKKLYYVIPLVLLLGFLFAFAYSIGKPEGKVIKTLPTGNSSLQSSYNTMMAVLMHPRCINCHPGDDVPKQGDQARPHYFGVSRGANDKGFKATQCATCHQSQNNTYSGVPGAPHWALAPNSMAWQGLSKNEIARALLDVTKNGNRSHEDLVHHLTEDALVLWAFNPGVDQNGIPRTKPAVSEEAYKKAVKDWFSKGAIVPQD